MRVLSRWALVWAAAVGVAFPSGLHAQPRVSDAGADGGTGREVGDAGDAGAPELGDAGDAARPEPVDGGVGGAPEAPAPLPRDPSTPAAGPDRPDAQETSDGARGAFEADVHDSLAAPGAPITHSDATGEAAPPRIRYFLERVEVRGNSTTRDYVVRRFVPIDEGDVFDVDDPAIEIIRWRLLGTGYFSDVRLRLRRGTRRGWVVLVIEVEERNTVVVQQVAIGVAEAVRRSSDTSADLLPYAGITVAETNLLGLGMEVSLSLAASRRQQGGRVRFTDPVFLGSSYLVSASAFYNNAVEFFGNGNDVRVAIVCPPLAPGEECPPEVVARHAVVFYKRYGFSLGTGHDLGRSTRYTLDWQADIVNVTVRPEAASHRVGLEHVPINFAIADGLSLVSTLQLGLIHDRRDNPALPSRGLLIRFRGDAGSRIFGSDYSFLRLQAQVRYWVPLPWGHHLRLGVFGGAVFGDAPFFYRFYASDLSDLIPSRVLEMNLDSRSPPNLLGTAVAEMRNQELAGRVDVEYGLPLYRGDGGFRAVNAYFSVGLYALADRRDLQAVIPGYTGLSTIPVDLTFDIGVRADTSVGLFQLGFSNLLGFIQPFQP